MPSDLSFKKILITGINGFIGSNILEYYLSEGLKGVIRGLVLPGSSFNRTVSICRRYGIDIPEKISDRPFVGDKLEFFPGNILRKTDLENAVKDVDAVVHLAGPVTDWAPSSVYRKGIVEGTRNVLEVALENGVGRFIFMSSLTVHKMCDRKYGDENLPRDMDFFPYGKAKIAAEEIIEVMCTENGADFACIRPGFIIYGPYDTGSFIRVLESLYGGKFAYINGGRKLISYVYAGNLAAGIFHLLKMPSGSLRGPYIIADGNSDWRSWIAMWCRALGVKEPRFSVSYRSLYLPVKLMELFYRLINRLGIKKEPPLTVYRIKIPATDLAFIGKKMKEIGFEPPFDIETGVKRTIEYFFEEYLPFVNKKHRKKERN